jgi:hypothetical protein
VSMSVRTFFSFHIIVFATWVFLQHESLHSGQCKLVFAAWNETTTFIHFKVHTQTRRHSKTKDKTTLSLSVSMSLSISLSRSLSISISRLLARSRTLMIYLCIYLYLYHSIYFTFSLQPSWWLLSQFHISL